MNIIDGIRLIEEQRKDAEVKHGALLLLAPPVEEQADGATFKFVTPATFVELLALAGKEFQVASIDVSKHERWFAMLHEDGAEYEIAPCVILDVPGAIYDDAFNRATYGIETVSYLSLLEGLNGDAIKEAQERAALSSHQREMERATRADGSKAVFTAFDAPKHLAAFTDEVSDADTDER